MISLWDTFCVPIFLSLIGSKFVQKFLDNIRLTQLELLIAEVNTRFVNSWRY